MIKILLLIDLSSGYDRRLLRGLVNYSKEHGPWIFYRMQLPSQWSDKTSDEILSWAREWGANAIIGRWKGASEDCLRSLNIPIVLQNNVARSRVYSNITGDYIGSGRMAAEFFLGKRLRNFAFFGVKNSIWSQERMQGFVSSLKKNGCGDDIYTYECDMDLYSMRLSVLKWLRSLPKPVGLFCCDDEFALYISEICRAEGISIPDEISLLGTDNDDLLCMISDPPISSIELNVEKGGYQTGQMLDRMIHEHSTESFSIVVHPTVIHERASTDRFNVEDQHVKTVISYIDANFRNDISISDILNVVPLSRRSIEMRFRREMGTSIYQYLLGCRVEYMANQLVTTDKPLSVISAESGFVDNRNISRIFKKVKGCSPVEYRQANTSK